MKTFFFNNWDDGKLAGQMSAETLDEANIKMKALAAIDGETWNPSDYSAGVWVDNLEVLKRCTAFAEFMMQRTTDLVDNPAMGNDEWFIQGMLDFLDARKKV